MVALPLRTSVFFLSICSLLLACSKHPSDDYQDYLNRLARSLGSDTPNLQSKTSLSNAYPNKRQLAAEVPAVKIDLIEFWGFRRCGLAPLIAERNSVLGKVASPSQRLYYEARLLEGLKFCQEQLEDQQQKTLAQSLYQQKLTQWPDRVWNAQFAGAELQSFWNLAGNNNESVNEDFDQLSNLDRVRESSYVASLSQADFEIHFRNLDLHRSGGALLKETHYAIASLELGNLLISQYLAKKTLCPKGKTTPNAKIAHNVLLNKFIQEIQPKLARLDRKLEHGYRTVDTLTRTHSMVHKDKLANFLQHLNTQHNQLKEQAKNHVRHWQKLFHSCRAINPGT